MPVSLALGIPVRAPQRHILYVDTGETAHEFFMHALTACSPSTGKSISAILIQRDRYDITLNANGNGFLFPQLVSENHQDNNENVNSRSVSWKVTMDSATQKPSSSRQLQEVGVGIWNLEY